VRQVHFCYRCIAHEILKHRHETHPTVCVKYDTKEFTHQVQVLVSQHLKQWLRLIQSETSVVRFHNTFLSHNCVSLSQYSEFWGKLFCAILYTCSGVFSMLVPQSFRCNASRFTAHSDPPTASLQFQLLPNVRYVI
jgi:hypothetical protein